MTYRVVSGGNLPGCAVECARRTDRRLQSDIAIAEALRGARAAINVARAALFPTITGRVTLIGSRLSLNRAGVSDDASEAPRADYLLPAIEASYEADVWGRIRRNVEANIASAQATAADLETVRLSLQADLAVNYFALLGLDAQKQLLDFIIAAFERAVTSRPTVITGGGRTDRSIAGPHATRDHTVHKRSMWGCSGHNSSTPLRFSSANCPPSSPYLRCFSQCDGLISRPVFLCNLQISQAVFPYSCSHRLSQRVCPRNS